MVTQGTPVAPAALGGIIPAGASGGGTATIGTQEIPFPRQVWEQSDWNAWRQRQDEYDRKKQEAEENRQFMELLGQNTRTNQAAKAVESARQFIEMRGFDRDLRAAKAAGLSDEQAFLQSAFRHPGMFGGGVGTGMGSLVRASRPEPVLADTLTWGGWTAASSPPRLRTGYAAPLSAAGPYQGASAGHRHFFSAARGPSHA